jgi:uracil-DNA glycosylase family protein
MIQLPQRKISAADFMPPERDLDSLRDAARSCRGCDLYRNAAQTVFGEGPGDAPLVFVGEQPEREDDEQGQPFVGPAGKLLRVALAEVGIDAAQVYFTNIVKHFKPAPDDPSRSVLKPAAREIRACFPWLVAELEAIRPEMIVCLGAVASQALLGPRFRVSKQHGEVFSTSWAPWTIATYHPAAILRSPDAIRADVQQALLSDLRLVAERLAQCSHHAAP